MSSKDTPSTNLNRKELKEKQKRQALMKTPDLTEGQLRTLNIISRNKMANVAFYFAIIAFTIILLSILSTIFIFNSHYSIPLSLIGLDGLLAFAVKQIYSYLFPPICKDKKTGEIRSINSTDNQAV